MDIQTLQNSESFLIFFLKSNELIWSRKKLLRISRQSKYQAGSFLPTCATVFCQHVRQFRVGEQWHAHEWTSTFLQVQILPVFLPSTSEQISICYLHVRKNKNLKTVVFFTDFTICSQCILELQLHLLLSMYNVFQISTISQLIADNLQH